MIYNLKEEYLIMAKCRIELLKESNVSTSPVKYKQCVNVTHVSARFNNGKDTHLVRCKIHYEDGTIGQRTEAWYDYMRPFYVTSREFRTYRQKKSREEKKYLDEYWCTDSQLLDRVKSAIGKSVTRMCRSLNQVAKLTPYLYGSSIPAAVFIKNEINSAIKDPDYIPAKATYTAFDIESDVYRGKGENPEIITVASSDRRATLHLGHNYHPTVDFKLLDELIAKHFPDWDIKVECESSTVGLIHSAFKTVNFYDNDYAGVWNINYDFPLLEKCLAENGSSMDQAIHGYGDKIKPSYWYKKGVDTKVTVSGKSRRLTPSEIWNSVRSTSASAWVDSMVLVRVRRLGFQEIPGGYSINNILNFFIGKGKLKLIPELDNLSALEWHIQMQKRYPTEYAIYALYDVLGMIELDEDIGDVSSFLQEFDTTVENVNKSSATTDDVFAIVNDSEGWINCHYALTEDIEERESKLFDLGGWIAIVPSYLFLARKLTNEFFKQVIDTVFNSVSSFVQDEDLISSYPKQLIATNASLATTVFEWLAKQPNIIMTEFKRRKALMNRPTGPAGQREVCVGVLRLPDFDEIADLVKEFRSKKS